MRPGENASSASMQFPASSDMPHLKDHMTHALTSQATELHEAARLLFHEFTVALPSSEWIDAWLSGVRSSGPEGDVELGTLRAEVYLRAGKGAAVEFVHETVDGAREVIGRIDCESADQSSAAQSAADG